MELHEALRKAKNRIALDQYDIEDALTRDERESLRSDVEMLQTLVDEIETLQGTVLSMGKCIIKDDAV